MGQDFPRGVDAAYEVHATLTDNGAQYVNRKRGNNALESLRAPVANIPLNSRWPKSITLLLSRLRSAHSATLGWQVLRPPAGGNSPSSFPTNHPSLGVS